VKARWLSEPELHFTWKNPPTTPKIWEGNLDLFALFDPIVVSKFLESLPEVVFAYDGALLARQRAELTSNRSTLEVLLAFLFAQLLHFANNPDLSGHLSPEEE